MEGTKQAPRLTNERIVLSSDELRMQVNLMLIHNLLCTLPRKGIVREMAIKHLGLDLSMTYDGTTPLKFISEDSLLNLKDACDTTKIQDFLQCLFVESEAVAVLGRGKVNFKKFMCKMTPEEYGHYIQTEGKLTEGREDQERKMLSLFVEELDPNKLFEDLRNRDLVEENDKQQVMDCIPRKQGMEFLIGRLNRLKRNEMLNILLAHCVKHDYCCLWRRIIDIYGSDTGNTHFTRRSGEYKSFPGEKVVTADFPLSTQDFTGALKVDVQNHTWHLDTVEEREDEEQKILSLFVEEPDPDLLFEDLRNKHLVGENDREFKNIKHDNYYLWKKTSDIYGRDTGNSNFTGKRVQNESLPNQKLFSADFTLSTQASESYSPKQSQKDLLEKRVVSTVNSTKGRKRLSAQSERLFGKKFYKAYQKCIVLHFKHNEGDSLEDLKHICYMERNIVEFVQGVFEGTGIENMMREGDFKWKLSLLLMQVKQLNLESLARVFDSMNGSSKDDIFKICVEELDPRILCKDSKQEGVLDESDEAEMLGKASRMDRMLFLIYKLAHKPDGYKVLVKHCMSYSKYVIQKLEENEIMMSLTNHMTTASSQADVQSSSDTEVLYTATVVMKIKAKEQTIYRLSGTQDQTKGRGSVTSEEYEITCSHILDPVYYFDDVLKNKTTTPQKDLFMVLQGPFEEEGNMSFFRTGSGRELYASEVGTYVKSTITSQNRTGRELHASEEENSIKPMQTLQMKKQHPKRRKIIPIDEKRHKKRKRSLHSDDAASAMLS